jgi:hypothetical protein
VLYYEAKETELPNLAAYLFEGTGLGLYSVAVP